MGNILIFYACPKFPANVSFECSNSAKKIRISGLHKWIFTNSHVRFCRDDAKIGGYFPQKKNCLVCIIRWHAGSSNKQELFLFLGFTLVNPEKQSNQSFYITSMCTSDHFYTIFMYIYDTINIKPWYCAGRLCAFSDFVSR